MPRGESDGRLLRAFQAYHLGLETRRGLVEALGDWAEAALREDGEGLVDRGVLEGHELGLIQALASDHPSTLDDGDAADIDAIDLDGGMPADRPGDDASTEPGPSTGDLPPLDDEPGPSTGDLPPLDDEPSPPEGGRFRILRRHRPPAGPGVIFVAWDSELDRQVALKQIREDHADDPPHQVQFLFEGRVTGRLEHPGIVPVYGLGRDARGRPYYAMKMIRGESLKEAIARHHDPNVDRADAGRAVASRKLLRRFLAVCDAIDYAHSRGVLHRDIKPANIMLGPHGETLVVDWGLAMGIAPVDRGDDPDAQWTRPEERPGASDDGTIPNFAGGTLYYMSPEQARGDPAGLGRASDVYGLGATLYSLLTGRLPFKDPGRPDATEEVLGRVRLGDFPPPRAVDPTIAAGLEAICLKAMALEPEARHASARDLAEDLERWLAEEPVSAYREAVARCEALVGQDPDRPNHREGLARSRSDLALALHVLGRGAEAVALQRGAIDEYHALVREHPPVTGYRDGLAGACSNLGRILMALGREGEAKDAYRAAFAEYERLVQAAPRALDYRTHLGELMISLGRSIDDVQETLGRLADGPVGDDLLAAPPPDPDETPDYDPHGTRTLADSTFDAAYRPGPGMVSNPGLEFGFRYEIIRLTARGGLSHVWLAHDRELHRDVALKDLPHVRMEGRRWFLREAQITAQLTHPNIVPVYDLGRSQSGRPFYTMKYVEGGTLREFVRKLHESRPPREAPDPSGLRRALDAFLLACQALEYAHSRGIVHRDVKPSNILIGAFGETYLGDWGLAKVDGRGQEGTVDDPLRESPDVLATREGSVVGTPAYMSPEQAGGDPARIDASTDVWALGATLFHILAGSPPRRPSHDMGRLFEEIRLGLVPRASEVAPWVPSALEAICDRAMAPRPEDRYASAGLLAEDLRRRLSGEPDPLRGRPGPGVPWYRRLGGRAGGGGGARSPLDGAVADGFQFTSPRGLGRGRRRSPSKAEGAGGPRAPVTGRGGSPRGPRPSLRE